MSSTSQSDERASIVEWPTVAGPVGWVAAGRKRTALGRVQALRRGDDRMVLVAAGRLSDVVPALCLDWGYRHGVASACLVVSELVSNVVLHAVTDMEVFIARHGRRLRLAVRDSSSQRPLVQPEDVERLHGRGLALVDGFSRAWGTLPVAGGGKVAWAVLDV
jgi:hypothetical protein